MDSIVAIVSICLCLINLVVLYIYTSKVKKYQKMYEDTLSKFNNTANVQDKFCELFARLAETEEFCEETKKFCEKVLGNLENTIKKVGLIKYNAYDDKDNKLSFALALLDDKNNGLMLNYVYSSHGSNLYLKQIEEAKITERISQEEANALELAMNQRSDKKIKAPKLNKVKTKSAPRTRNYKK
ncbi:MAG: DUF4446 family protein [Clostridia bacterium]|nr:DUF4446 family protein [Clostridia bacterium]